MKKLIALPEKPTFVSIEEVKFQQYIQVDNDGSDQGSVHSSDSSNAPPLPPRSKRPETKSRKKSSRDKIFSFTS